MTNSAPTPAPQKKALWTPARIVSSCAVLALVAAFLLPACSSSSDIAKPNTPANSGAPKAQPPARPPLPAAILNTELKDIEGKPFKLSDYSGKVVVVNLWATWCGPCRVEIPELIKLSEEYKARGVEVIGLTSEDPVDDAALVKDFVAKQKITYRVGWGNREFSLGLMQGNVRDVIPQSFVISGDGRVVAHLTGFNPNSTPERLKQAVEQALSLKA